MELPAAVAFYMTIATTILNLIAAVLVAIQKFYNLNERCALHENIKDVYFQVIHEQERVRNSSQSIMTFSSLILISSSPGFARLLC